MAHKIYEIVLSDIFSNEFNNIIIGKNAILS